MSLRMLFVQLVSAASLGANVASGQTVLWSNPSAGQPVSPPSAAYPQPGYGQPAYGQPVYSPPAHPQPMPHAVPRVATQYPGYGTMPISNGLPSISNGLPSELTLPPALPAPALPMPGDPADAVIVSPGRPLVPQPSRTLPDAYEPVPNAVAPSYSAPSWSAGPDSPSVLPEPSADDRNLPPRYELPSPGLSFDATPYDADQPDEDRSASDDDLLTRPYRTTEAAPVVRPNWQIPSAAKVWMSAHKFR